jgi:type II secretory pathway pseudopilin PulG
MTRRHLRAGRRRARGVVLLAFLIVLALVGLGAMAAFDVWSVQRQREREAQLLFVGHQFRAAIRDYYYGGPGGTGRSLPTSLDMLLDDDRFPVPVHHLRRLYADPMTGSTDWGLLMVGDRIMGVYSKSEAQPVKQKGFALIDASFEDKSSYRDWVFAFVAGRHMASIDDASFADRTGLSAAGPLRTTSKKNPT